jgi:VWFA-related protein
MRRASPLVAALALGGALLLARQAPRPPVFRTGVDLVEVPAVVTDGQGRFVSGLAAADFEIAERGVPQAIVAFDRVSIPIWRPEASAPAPVVPADVSTNERLADGRLFALVLDSLHVSPPSVAAVRKQARQFIEEHVGPADLVAVLSLGGIDGASQDFTGDKARLLAAVDRFAGGRLRPATIELEEERQGAATTGVLAHGGKDPSDGERADRARSLASVLEALAGHLGRVEGRRKALLLFSEGTDYNVADFMGTVQAHASDVMHAMDRALGALMRANVSLYAIDPRGLASVDTAGERLPAHEAPNAPRANGSIPRMDFSEPSLEAEFAASIASLRHLADPTGGFAATASNDAATTFGRIVRESSDYYVLAYVPARRGKPGEFQPIRVAVRRAGLHVVARAGYTVAGGPAPAVAVEPPSEPVLGSPFAARRTGRAEAPPVESQAAPAPKGLESEMASLLSSALPVAGLPIRVQTASFRGSGKRPLVQVVTEVRGSSIAFVERGGRFASRVELASFTVDSRGRGANGRSTRLDLDLTRDEVARVRATGIRWMSQLDLAPGRHQLRVAARVTGTGAAGMVTADVEVPAFDDAPGVSGIVLTSQASAQMLTRGQSRLATPLATPPTAERSFLAGERVVAAVEVYCQRSGTAPTGVTASVVRADGSVVTEHREALPQGNRRDVTDVALPIDTRSMSPGRYVLRVRLDGVPPTDQVERRVPFEIVPGSLM